MERQQKDNSKIIFSKKYEFFFYSFFGNYFVVRETKHSTIFVFQQCFISRRISHAVFFCLSDCSFHFINVFNDLFSCNIKILNFSLSSRRNSLTLAKFYLRKKKLIYNSAVGKQCTAFNCSTYIKIQI